jgi:molybdopterin converting factor small subunit
VARVLVTASDCDELTGGLRSLEVEAADIRGLLQALDARFPGLREILETRVALAVDGAIVSAWTGPLRPDSEVALIPRLGGG